MIFQFAVILFFSSLCHSDAFFSAPVRNEDAITRLKEKRISHAELDRSFRVGIVGAGAIAFGTAALLVENSHVPMIWSPTGQGTKHLEKTGRLSVERNHGNIKSDNTQFLVDLALTAKDLLEHNDVVIVALPANGHKAIFEAIAPFLQRRHHVIISSHSSFGALYLARLLRERSGDTVITPITAWGTTICTARRPSGASLRINTVRKSVDFCTIPMTESDAALSLCQSLFPQVETFRPRDGLLAITLSNLNPQNHLGIAIGNISRMEKGEQWYQSAHITPTIGRLLEALDEERLAIAEALELETKTIFEHFSVSFLVPIRPSISEMNQEINREGNDVFGPDTVDSRYITEDVPFGLIPIIMLGQMVNRPAKLHESGVELLSAMYGRNFWAENDLLPALSHETSDLHALKEAARTGIYKH